MEKFIKINGWEQSYEISSFGRIKCLNYLHHKDKIYLTTGIKCSNGYLKYELKLNGIKQVFLIHRLVAIAFIPNPENKPCVNHKNGIKDDNRVENLEWSTFKENNNHAVRNGLINRPFKCFVGTSIKNLEKIYFDNIQEAAEFVKGNRANIHKCLNRQNNRVVAYGYTWEYV